MTAWSSGCGFGPGRTSAERGEASPPWITVLPLRRDTLSPGVRSYNQTDLRKSTHCPTDALDLRGADLLLGVLGACVKRYKY